MGLFSRNDWRDTYKRLPERELLERIRNGDPLADEFLSETYRLPVVKHMEAELRKYGSPDLSDTPDDYAQDAILLLITQARRIGSDVLKHENTPISGWLKKTATNFMRNRLRRDNRFERDQDQLDEQGQPKSGVGKLEDKGADAFTDMPQKDRDQLIHEVLASLPIELQTLIRLKFMEGYSWKETAELMRQLHPDHTPPFALDYLQKTYWDRVHKKPFIKRLGNNLDNE